MNRKHKKISVTFKIFLGLTIAYLALFFILLFVFGALAGKTTDPDLKGGIGDLFKYHFSDIGGLFTFKFHEASNVVYFSLSGLLYFVIFIAILYLIVGILLVVKRHKPFIFFGIVASLIVILVYILIATGLPKYWAIINHRAPFEKEDSLVGTTFGILLFGGLYIITAYLLYFVSLFVAIKTPKVNEETGEDELDESFDEDQGEIREEDESEQAPKLANPANEEPVIFEEIDPSRVAYPNGAPVVEQTVAPIEEKAPVQVSEPAPVEVKEITPIKEEEKPQPEVKEEVEKPQEEKEDLKALLKEVVRDIVRDEIARNNANQARNENGQNNNGVPITGATFGGPLVVQYFNGGINSASPAQEPVKEENKPAPQEVVPEPVQEEKKEPEKEAEPAIESAPIQEEQPQEIVEELPQEPAPKVEENNEEKKPIIRIPFTTRMINADKEMQDNYNELKNEIMSYGVNSRVSNSGDTFRLHRVTYIKITIAGLSLKLYFALNPDDYKDSTLPIQNAGHKGIYAEIPLVFKVKSGLSMRRCKQLIQDVFDKNGLEQGEIGNTNWVEELKNAPADESDED